jgi:hypothetical protein
MAKKKAASKPAKKKGKSAATSNKLVFHISVMADGEVVIDEAFGNVYSNRGGKKVEWTITSGLEFKLDFNLIPYAGPVQSMAIRPAGWTVSRAIPASRACTSTISGCAGKAPTGW